jgi:hypothetical protein
MHFFRHYTKTLKNKKKLNVFNIHILKSNKIWLFENP